MPGWQKFKRATLFLIFLALLVLLTQRISSSKPQCLPAAQLPASTTLLEIVNEDRDAIQDIALKTEYARSAWEQKVGFFKPEGEWGGWVTQLQIDTPLTSNDDHFIENPIRVPAKAKVHGYFLVRNAWKKSHDLRVIFFLDFQQVLVKKLDKSYGYYDLPVMESQEDRAFEFVISEMADGFHQLSFLLITDPQSLSTDSTYRALQQRSFYEGRYDLWVGINELPQNIMVFESSELGQSAASRLGVIELLKSPIDETNTPLFSMKLASEQKHCLYLRLFNCGIECRKESEVNKLYSGPVPLRIGIFWNDKLEQVLNYDLRADAPDNLTLQIEIETPKKPGLYQLHVVGFAFPGFSQFTASLERTTYPPGLYSRRILVDVQP